MQRNLSWGNPINDCFDKSTLVLACPQPIFARSVPQCRTQVESLELCEAVMFIKHLQIRLRDHSPVNNKDEIIVAILAQNGSKKGYGDVWSMDRYAVMTYGTKELRKSQMNSISRGYWSGGMDGDRLGPGSGPISPEISPKCRMNCGAQTTIEPPLNHVKWCFHQNRGFKTSNLRCLPGKGYHGPSMAFYAALGVGFLVQRCCKIQHIASGLQRNSTWHWLFGSFGHLFPQYSKDFHPPWLPENSNVVLTRQPSKSSPGRFKMLLQIWAKHRLTRVLLERCTWGTLQRAERDPHWADFLKPRNGGPDASLIQRSCFLSFSDFFWIRNHMV